MTISKHARPRRLAATGAILLFIVGAILLWLNVRKNTLSIADRRTDDVFDAARDRARAAIEDGRFVEGSELYRTFDDRRLEAEDFYGLGSALLARNRIVPGWTALEAARRIDHTHTATLNALDQLQSKLTPGADRESTAVEDVINRVEFLLSVPDGRPLGVLIMGLVRYTNDPAQEQEIFDRLMAHDRSTLRRVDSGAAALRLVARLLLEMGRPADADDLLQALVGPSSDSLDREAAWLLSRAALQLDQQEKADSMLLLAGDFGRNATPIEEPSPFVGSRRCRDCHLRTYREQQESSRHAHTLRFGPDLKSVPLPTRPVADPVFPRMTHHFSRKNDEQIDLETRTDDRTIHAIVEYALGSGRHGISMVARDDAGIDRELRISYFADAQTWVKTKGIDMAPQDAGDHIGLALSPASLDHCLNCHKTSFRPIDPSRRGRQWPETQDHGIGCERCHGPGLNHVKAAETGFAELAIAQTSTTPALSRLRSCTECHASDGSVNASDPEFTRAQGTTLLFSKCFTRSQDQIGCTTCHDPHRLLEKSIPQYEAICLACHSPDPARITAQSPRMVMQKVGHPPPTSCPVSPATNCIACHMPKVGDVSRRAQFTDHHIRVHRHPVAAQAFDGGQ